MTRATMDSGHVPNIIICLDVSNYRSVKIAGSWRVRVILAPCQR